MRKEFRDLGLGISPESLGISEAFNDELSKSAQVWEAAKLQIGSSIATAALPQLLELNAWLKSNSGEFRGWLKEAGEAIVKAMRGIVEAGKWIIDNKDSLIDWAKTLGLVYLGGMVIPMLGTALSLMGRFGIFGTTIANVMASRAAGGAATTAAAGAAVGSSAAGAAAKTAAGAGSAGAEVAKRTAAQRIAPYLGPIAWGATAGMLMSDVLGVPERSAAQVSDIARTKARSSIMTGTGPDDPEVQAARAAAVAEQRRQKEAAAAERRRIAVDFAKNMSPSAGQLAFGAVGAAAKVVVAFENAPAGMAVKAIETPAAVSVDVTTRRGPRTLGTGAGL